jgi:large subunit ribosomal protein L22
MVRGRKVEEALALLRFATTPIARIVAKTVKSAAANAENNFQMTPSDLKIVTAFADNAPSLRRYRPRARGRVSHIVKRSSNITVVVTEVEG